MQGKIALEEHFALEETLGDSQPFAPVEDWPELKHRLLDIHERRLHEMDKGGVELMLLSLNAPAVQAIADLGKAEDMARRANDFLAEQVARRPDRFQALAALAMQTPEMATRELVRCVKELGFRGALVNGFSEAAGSEKTRLLRHQAVLAVLGGGRKARRAVLSASAQSVAARRRDL